MKKLFVTFFAFFCFCCMMCGVLFAEDVQEVDIKELSLKLENHSIFFLTLRQQSINEGALLNIQYQILSSRPEDIDK